MRAMNTDPVEPDLPQIARAIELSGGAAPFARALGVSIQTARFWREGKRGLRSEYGARIETLTGGKVRRQDIWPVSWQVIWPELAAYEAAQPLKTEEVGHVQ